MDMLTTIGELRFHISEASKSGRPIETRLLDLIDRARDRNEPVSLYTHFGVFPEFDSHVRKVIITPDAMIEFFIKDGTSMGKFTLDQLTTEYPDE